MKISIIIPVINEAETIRRSVSRAWSSGADEVIVVDGGSTDETSEIALSIDCRLLHSAAGRAVQMNHGAAATDADVVVFLHADNWLAESTCDQIRSTLADTTIEYGAFRQRIDNAKAIYRWIESGNHWRVRWQGLIYGDQALFVRRTTFERVGGFPEMPLMEDFEFSRTLKRLGKPTLLPGPTFVSARRWETAGPIRQTVRNWSLSLAYRCGASPDWLATKYRRHDK